VVAFHEIGFRGETIADFCRRNGIRRLALFGSARGVIDSRAPE